jgi:hypothetical protein
VLARSLHCWGGLIGLHTHQPGQRTGVYLEFSRNCFGRVKFEQLDRFFLLLR